MKKRHTRIKIYNEKAHGKNGLNIKHSNNSRQKNDVTDRTFKITI
jgi:hypothetical protein